MLNRNVEQTVLLQILLEQLLMPDVMVGRPSPCLPILGCKCLCGNSRVVSTEVDLGGDQRGAVGVGSLSSSAA